MACNIHERDEKCIQNFWLEILKGRDHSEVLGIDEKIILDWILGKECGKLWIECIWWLALVNGVMNLWVP